MAHCIYSGADENSASFDTEEHIFPKCIGGTRRLPKGWVSDAVNNSFSRLELGFARSNPTVATSRMFLAQTGRKKHKNREHIGIFKNVSDSSDYALGYVKNATPFPISQIVITYDFSSNENQAIPVRIILAPSYTDTYETQLQELWTQLRKYTGSPCCIKGRRMHPHTYLLGCQDQKWFLGISENENPEDIKPHLKSLVDKISLEDSKSILSHTGNIISEQHKVEFAFSFEGNYLDYLRVYAKIAVNCLAYLKGQTFVQSHAFDDIKRAILTGENIKKYVYPTEGPSMVLGVLRTFPEQLVLGEHCHTATFLQKDGWVYGAVSLYGLSNPYIVKLGMVESRVETDFYICDWEHHVDYTMMECVLKICKYDEEE